eukprot:scaffold87029_cov26-Tisochrysis_lutea.AAC.5
MRRECGGVAGKQGAKERGEGARARGEENCTSRWTRSRSRVEMSLQRSLPLLGAKRNGSSGVRPAGWDGWYGGGGWK